MEPRVRKFSFGSSCRRRYRRSSQGSGLPGACRSSGSAWGRSGFYRIVESGYRLNIPRMFAALILLSLTGIAIFFALSSLSDRMLRHWHESALSRER